MLNSLLAFWEAHEKHRPFSQSNNKRGKKDMPPGQFSVTCAWLLAGGFFLTPLPRAENKDRAVCTLLQSTWCNRKLIQICSWYFFALNPRHLLKRVVRPAGSCTSPWPGCLSLLFLFNFWSRLWSWLEPLCGYKEYALYYSHWIRNNENVCVWQGWVGWNGCGWLRACTLERKVALGNPPEQTISTPEKLK